MKITIKTVNNKLFTVEAEETETVANLKAKIKEAQQFEVDQQKLIYSGKILKDDATVGELKIKEKDFLVVMVSKPKAAPAAAPAAAAPAASSSTPAAAPAAPAAAAAPEAAPVAEAPAADAPMGSSFLTGTARNTAVDGLVEMGFSRDQVDRAMRAAFNNPDRAAEYLISGNIPETEAPAPPAAAPAAVPAAGAAAAAAPAAAASPARAAPSSSGAAADNLFAAAEAAMQQDDRSGAVGGGASQLESQLGGSLDSIVNSPQIQRIRAAVQENPALIGPLMQQIAAANPQLAALLQQDPQALYELLGVEEVDEGGLPPNVMHVNLTQEESAAVERLEQLGFDRQLVLQAFLICDKNEELAANFLFESTEEDEQMQ